MPDVANHRDTAWKTIDRELLLSAAPWLEVYRERLELPSGRVIDDFYHIKLPQFAVVVPWTPSGEVVLVRGYKHGVGRVNLSPPAGLIEATETPLEAAQRELLEETGHTADDWQPLGRFVTDGNRGCGTMHLFAAHGARRVRQPCDDETEPLHVELMSKDELLAALRRGEVGNLAGAGGLGLAFLLALPAEKGSER